LLDGKAPDLDSRTVTIQIPHGTYALNVETRSLEGVSRFYWNKTTQTTEKIYTACWPPLELLYSIGYEAEPRVDPLYWDDANNIVKIFPTLDSSWTEQIALQQLYYSCLCTAVRLWPTDHHCCNRNPPPDFSLDDKLQWPREVSYLFAGHSVGCPRRAYFRAAQEIQRVVDPYSPNVPNIFGPLETHPVPLKPLLQAFWNKTLIQLQHGVQGLPVITWNPNQRPTLPQPPTTCLSMNVQKTYKAMGDLIPPERRNEVFYGTQLGTQGTTLHPLVKREASAGHSFMKQVTPATVDSKTANATPVDPEASYEELLTQVPRLLPSGHPALDPTTPLYRKELDGDFLQYRTILETVSFYLPREQAQPTTSSKGPSFEDYQELAKPWSPLAPPSPPIIKLNYKPSTPPYREKTAFPFPPKRLASPTRELLNKEAKYITGSEWIEPEWIHERCPTILDSEAESDEDNTIQQDDSSPPPSRVPSMEHIPITPPTHTVPMHIQTNPDAEGYISLDKVSIPPPTDQHATISWTCTADNPATCKADCPPRPTPQPTPTPRKKRPPPLDLTPILPNITTLLFPDERDSPAPFRKEGEKASDNNNNNNNDNAEEPRPLSQLEQLLNTNEDPPWATPYRNENESDDSERSVTPCEFWHHGHVFFCGFGASTFLNTLKFKTFQKPTNCDV